MLSVLEGFPFPAPLTRERLSWGALSGLWVFLGGSFSSIPSRVWEQKKTPGTRLLGVPRVQDSYQFCFPLSQICLVCVVYDARALRCISPWVKSMSSPPSCESAVLPCVLRAWVTFQFSFLPPSLPPSTCYPPTPNWISRCSWNIRGFPGESDGKEFACNAGDPGLIPGKIPWRRKWQPTPVFWPGEFYGQGSLAAIHGVTESGHDIRTDTWKLEVLAVLDWKSQCPFPLTLSAEVLLIPIYSLYCVDWYRLPAVFIYDNWKAWGVSGTRYRMCSHSDLEVTF